MTDITLHVIADVLDQPQRDRLIQHLQIAQPKYVNVKGAERLDVALELVERITSQTKTTVIFRQWPDDGLWKTKSVEQWYAERIAPRRAWLRANRVIFMPDNESLESDLTAYARWMTQAIVKCAADGIPLAVARFATGNPAENQYAQLDLMWQTLKDFGGIWSPNEYFGLTPQLSAGHLNRYMHGWDRCKELNIPAPTTVIGESGLCKSNDGRLDPYTGFRKLNVSDADYARNFVIPNFEQWYKPRGVTMSVFCYGDWDGHGFDVGEDYLKAIQDYALKSAPPVIVAPIVLPPAPPPVLNRNPEPPPPLPTIDPVIDKLPNITPIEFGHGLNPEGTNSIGVIPIDMQSSYARIADLYRQLAEEFTKLDLQMKQSAVKDVGV